MRLRDNRLIALGTLGGFLLTAVLTGIGVVAWSVTLRDEVTANKTSDADHEKRLRQIETTVPVQLARIDEHVAWIHTFLRTPHLAPAPPIAPPLCDPQVSRIDP